MKLTTLLMIIGCIHVSAAGYSQKINLSERNVSLNSVFSKMEKQSGYHFFSNSEFIAALPNVSVSIKNATLSEALNEILSKVSLSYSIVDKTVVITPLSETVNGIKKAVPTLIIGAVLDEQGKPIPGANVKVKGTIQRTVTDQDGKFKIVVFDADAILQISYVGYQNKEVSIKDLKSPFIIKLYAVSGDLDQVQVIAYGTTTKRLNPGSSFTMKAEEIAKNPVPNVLQALENRVPGIAITQNTGQPGGSFLVRIRGINGNNNVDPLYIVDGVAYPAGGLNGGLGSGAGASGTLPLLPGVTSVNAQRGGNALNYINPEDIESIDILKDADATAIYGSRGAYGVVLITTKRAKAGKPTLSLNLNTGLTVRGTTPQLLNTADYLMIRREAIKNAGGTISATDVDLNGTYPANRYTDWQKELAGNAALTSRLNATYGGGNESTSFLVGASYNNQNSIQKGIGSNRDGGLRFDIISTTPDKKLKFEVLGSFNSTVNTMVPYDFSADGATRAPNAPSLFLPDGRLNWETGTNPAAAINLTHRGVTNNLLESTNLEYKPIKNLTLRAVLAYNLLSGTELNTIPTTYFNPANANKNISSAYNDFSIRTWTLDPNANYKLKLGTKGTLNLTVGGTLQDKLNTINQMNATGFLSDALLNNPASGSNVVNTYTRAVTRYMGYFGIASYNWDDKYILDVNVRRDGSTKFGPDNRWGTFGSVGGAYIFTREKWIREALPFLSFGKIKGSYGISGGDGINTYQYLSTYSVTTNYSGNTALSNTSLSNSALHWEHDTKADIGISLGFLKDRITIDGDYYKNTTSDQLIAQPLSTVTGFNSLTVNTPMVYQNSGLELSLVSHNIQGKNFSWTSYANMTVPHSKLVSVPAGFLAPTDDLVVGSPLTTIRLYNYAGVNPQTGQYNFINKAGVKDPFTAPLFLDRNIDRTQIFDLSTKYFGSFSNTITYKSISLDFTFSLINKTGVNYMGQQTTQPGIINQNPTEKVLDRWQKPGDITDVPAPTTNGLANVFGQLNFRLSTGAYERIVYSRLQNLSISYALPESFLKRVHIRSMRIIMNGQNLLTISKYGDLDPENLTASATPPLRVFNLGLNVSL